MSRQIDGLRVFLIFAAVVVQPLAYAAEPPAYAVAPTPPEWVKSAPFESGSQDTSSAAAAVGTEYLLSDRQIRVDGGWSEYGHFVMRATNPAGVSDISQITIDFDPQLDRLILHAVSLRRGNEKIDELQQGRIEVLQRESELEKDVLDGSLTFHLVMSDVRAGDAVDYSYTIEHRDPSWGNRFYGRFLTQWEDPVRWSRLRILARSQEPLYLRSPPRQEPASSDDGTWRSLDWVATDVPAVVEQKETPAWYEQYPAVEVSQFASWKALVDSALPLYVLPEKPSPELAALEKRLGASARSAPERVLAAIRFVQEEIRYTGLELGSGAYRPTPPDEVLRRRYGDCKDKTLLAVALLRGLGIDAAPALVSPRWAGHLHERLPSPGDFNHVIIKVRIASRTYWLDMTATGQGGDLENIVQADEGEALVIAPGVSALEEIPVQRETRPLLAANVDFDLRAGLDKEAALTVVTLYRRSEADTLRRQLRRQTVDQIGASYLDYYKRRYVSIRAVKAPQVADDLRANEITVTESYRIDKPFEVDDSGKYRFRVEAEIINEHLREPAARVRTLPLVLDDPVSSSEHIRIRMPEKFPGKDGTVTIDNPGFHYQSRVAHEGNDTVLDYEYRTLTDSVAREALEDFLKKRAAADDDTFYAFTTNPEKKQPNVQAAAALERLVHAAQLAQGGKIQQTDDALKELLASDGFAMLTAEQQHAGLYLAGVVAFETDPGRALDLLKRATAMDQAAAVDWMMRLRAANGSGNKDDATLCLATLLQRWPKSLNDLDLALVARTVNDTPRTAPTRYGLLSALFAAKYTAEGLEPSYWWRDLALLQEQRGEQSAAANSIASMTNPYALISVRADERFAPMRSSAQLDIPAAIDRQIKAARELVKAHPGELQPEVQLLQVLYQSLHFAEALQVADDAIAAMNGPKGPAVFSDYRMNRPWLLDGRSEALYRLGRWDEAVTQMRAASRLAENGNGNVSQVLNLAGLYNDLGRPADARATLGELLESTSPYGRMQVAIESLASAEQLGDTAEVERQLGFLREHRADSVASYQRALINADRQDEAAQLLISRLDNPDERVEALLELQQYQGARTDPGRAAQLKRRWKAICERPDVQAALSKVGNAGQYPLLAPGY